MSHEIIRSYNYDMLIPTSICFILGLFYYYYKYRNTRNDIENNINISNNPNNDQNSTNTQHNLREEINIDSNDLHSGDSHSNPEDILKIFVMVNGNRIQTDYSKNDTILNFINNQLIEHVEISINERDRLKLIFQGRILDHNKKFVDYPNITNDSVLHCYIMNSSQGTNEENNLRNENDRATTNSTNVIYDENCVSIYTLVTHLIILILIVILLTVYKIFTDIFTNGSLVILKIMIVVWVIQVSKCLAKVAVYKRILYH